MAHELVYRFQINVTRDLEVEGERGVERLLDTLRSMGWARERTKRRKHVDDQVWAKFEYGFEVDSPQYFDEAWPYDFGERLKAQLIVMDGVSYRTTSAALAPA